LLRLVGAHRHTIGRHFRAQKAVTSTPGWR
jgi:hypothetical protein